jgi:hypothetical protein
LEEAALAPSLHKELVVELVLSERLGVSTVPARKVGYVARSSCIESSRGVRGRPAVLAEETCLLWETEGVRDLSHEVSSLAPLSATTVVDRSEQVEDTGRGPA